MKKLAGILLFGVSVIIGISFILNMNVVTKQCIDYQCYTHKLPLYLKILDFFDRYYNYKHLVKIITKDAVTEQERVMKIFEWTYENIKKVPAGFSVIDDHVWYIIIRGYGVNDQASDVFTTLCNYAGIDAFFTWVMTPDCSKKVPLSFVKIKDKWYIFDPYNGVYFKNNKGSLADVEVIKSGRYSVQGQTGAIEMDYSSYISNLPSIKNSGFRRANIQSPLNRLLFEIKKWRK
jgi:hypothetical protein